MNRKVKTKWLKALRSGKYKQARQGLCFENQNGQKSFCCLGVLNDLYIKEMKPKVGWEHQETKSGGINQFNFAIEDSYLAPEVMKWADLEYRDPRVMDSKGEQTTLSAINDGKGFGFKRIANIIEKQL